MNCTDDERYGLIYMNIVDTCTSLSKEDKSKPSQTPRDALIFCKSLNSTATALIVAVIGILTILDGYLEARYQNRKFSQGMMELKKYGSPKMKLISRASGRSSIDSTILTCSERPFACKNISIVLRDKKFCSSRNTFAPNLAATTASRQPSERQRQTLFGVILFRRA